ncbi:MAG: DUF1343 domain-containing protein [Ignavibacteria bacterium]|nr:DUF1343 domain-containing protein [Ignavibacteria bacterium]
MNTSIVALLLLAGFVQAQRPHPAPEPEVKTGLQVFLAHPPEWVIGKRIGLITNQSGVDRLGRRGIDLLAARNDLKLVALFAFEHGLEGRANPGEKVQSGVDRATGLTIHSLYGSVRKPTRTMLEGIDVLIYDAQDVGVRTYTRLSHANAQRGLFKLWLRIKKCNEDSCNTTPGSSRLPGCYATI